MNRLLRRACFWLTDNKYLETDVNALRKQLLFRANNLGVRELDLIVGSWAGHALPNYNQPQLLAFN